MLSRTALGGIALVLALATGCSDDPGDADASPTDPGSSTTGSTGSDSAPSDPPSSAPGTSEPTETTPTTPAAATGQPISVDDLEGNPVVRLRMPEAVRWDITSGGAAAASYDLDPRGGLTRVQAQALFTTPGNTLDDYARDWAQVQAVPLERADDRTVNGVTGFVLQGQDERDVEYVFGGTYDDAFFTITFSFDREGDFADDAIESVLASAEWL